jgi:hypothetical protein
MGIGGYLTRRDGGPETACDGGRKEGSGIQRLGGTWRSTSNEIGRASNSPFSVCRSTSTVGLPRESKIWRTTWGENVCVSDRKVSEERRARYENGDGYAPRRT